METLKKRADFLRVAKGRRVALPGMLVQRAPSPPATPDPPPGANKTVRIGFTVTKKVGNAVVRNRARRRLRAAASQIFPEHGTPGHDYVLIARSLTVTCPFNCLLDDLKQALIKLDAPSRRKRVSRKSADSPNDTRGS